MTMLSNDVLQACLLSPGGCC